MKNTVIGIDIGGTNSRFAIIDYNAEIIFRDSIPTTEYPDFNDFIKHLCNLIKKAIKQLSGEYVVKGIGIGAANGNYYKGTIENAVNLPWKGNIYFTEIIERNLNLKAIITNDAKAAAIGEMVYGSAKGMNDFAVITLGTGLGSGIVVNGEPVYGSTGFAGELGHTIVVPNGRDCACGRKGCLERYVSATGIVITAKEMLENEKYNSILNPDDISSKSIYEAAVRNDKIALDAFDFTSKYLGIALANLVAVNSPEAIFLFGGLANAGEYILKPTEKYLQKHLLNNYIGTVKLLKSSIPENNSGVLGAAALIIHDLKKTGI